MASVVGLSSSPALAQEGIKAALANVPADAMGFVCVPSAKGTCEKIDKLIQQLGLGPMVLPVPLLEMIREQSGAGESLDDAGSIGFVMFEPASTSNTDLSAAAVLLLPAGDAEALMDTLGCEAETDGVRPLVFHGQDRFALAKGKCVYICASKEMLHKIKQAEKDITSRLQPASLEHLAGQDLAIWVDAQKLAKLLKPFIDGFLEVAQASGSSPASFTAIQSKSMVRNIDMLREGLDTAQLGLAISPKGIGLSVHMVAKASTKLGDLCTSYRSTDQMLMVGLPADKYILVGGQVVEDEAMKQSVSDLDPLFEAEELKEHCDPEQLATIREHLREMMLAIRGGAFGISALPESPEGLIGCTAVLKVADAKKWLEHVSKIIPAAKQVAKDEEAAKMLGYLKHEASRANIEGVDVDRVVFDVASAAELDEDDAAQLKKIIGKDGLTVWLAPAAEHQVVIVFGGGEARVAEVLKIAKAGQAPLGDDLAIKKVAANLPAKRYSELYFAGDRLVGLIDAIAKVMGEEGLPVQMAEVNAPIALVGSGEGLALRMDMFVPMEMVVAIKDTVMQAMGAMMMGGPKGPSDDETL